MFIHLLSAPRSRGWLARLSVPMMNMTFGLQRLLTFPGFNLLSASMPMVARICSRGCWRLRTPITVPRELCSDIFRSQQDDEIIHKRVWDNRENGVRTHLKTPFRRPNRFPRLSTVCRHCSRWPTAYWSILPSDKLITYPETLGVDNSLDAHLS